MKVLAIVPARGGSKGIPRKNLALCAGKPLIDWTWDAIGEARLIDRTVLSSEDPDIQEHRPPWVLLLRRSASLAQDITPLEPVIEEVLLYHEGDIIVLLQPTSPLRTSTHIDAAIRQFRASGVDSLVSVVPSHHLLWWDRPSLTCSYIPSHRPNRQQVCQYEENGAIYVFRRSLFEQTGCRLGGEIGLFVMEPEQNLQVDTSQDLALCERILLGRRRDAVTRA